MAKKSSIEKNNRRTQAGQAYAAKRAALKAIVDGPEAADRGAFPRAAEARRAAAQLVAKTRIRNRCEITGRPRAYYRKLKMSRIALRELGNAGQIPGLVKSSW